MILLFALLLHNLPLKVLSHSFLAFPAPFVLLVLLNVVAVQGPHAIAVIVLLGSQQLMEAVHGVIGSLDAQFFKSFHQKHPNVLLLSNLFREEVLHTGIFNCQCFLL